MSLLTVLALVFAVLYLAIVVRGAVRGGGSRAARGRLLTLRLCLLALLLAAALRPALTFQRLAPPPGPPVLLLDNSRSMSMFGAAQLWDTLLAPLTARLNTPVVLFGDSLRPLPAGQQPAFDDSRSYASEAGLASLSRARRVVLVSDGAWSNARLPRGFLSDHDVRCVTLSQHIHHPWIAIEALQERIESRQGDTSYLRVCITSRIDTTMPCTLRLIRGGVQAARRTVMLRAGTGRDTVALRLPTGSPGMALCRAVLSAEPVVRTAHAVHTVVPEQLRAASYAAHPRLDCRFMGRALRASGQWRLLAPSDTASRPHLLVLYDWDSTAEARVRRLARGGMCLFAGTLPCGGEDLRRLTDCSLVPVSTVSSPAYTLPVLPVPPPSAVRVCTGPSSRLQAHVLLRARTEGSPGFDSVPLVVSGVWSRRAYVGISATGFWRWDFGSLPDVTTRGQQSPFSSAVLAVVRERLVTRLTDGMVLFPTAPPLSASRPLHLLALFPPDEDWEARGTLHCVLRGLAGDTLADTTIEVGGADSRAEISLAPLAEGSYVCAASVSRRRSALHFVDTLQVEPDMTEQQVEGQNTHLLSQFGRHVAPEQASIAQLLQNVQTGVERRAIPVTLRIEPTWQLLLALLLLFSLEWALRRAWGFDPR